jgi:hypothetical protein
VRQDAAPEERPKLLLHEPGQAGPVRPSGRLVQERLQMLVNVNDGVEHGVFSIAGPVDRSLATDAINTALPELTRGDVAL